MIMVRTSNNDGNVNISGEGQVSGGTYGAVTINGAGSIKGDVACGVFRVNGAGTADGNVKADKLVINGTASFGGEVQAAEMTVNGDASITNGLGVGHFKVKGRCYVGGGVAAHDIDARGELTVGGDCESDVFRCEGAFTVGGLLNAGEVDIQLHAASKAREIGGERVTVRQGRGIASIFLFFADKRLSADTIEADDVTLEYVSAKVVRGARVEIGEGCDIELVEYTGEFRQSTGAKVGTANKVVAAEG
jgi:cytoskeletal protein CcmA (bactofilin family)